MAKIPHSTGVVRVQDMDKRMTAKTDAKASGVLANWDDLLLLDEQLTEDERLIRDSARAYCQES